MPLPTRIANIVGSVLTWPWPVLVGLSFTSTCTQGDDDSWATTLFWCTCITAVALPSLAASTGHRSFVRLSVLPATLIPLIVVGPHAVDTALAGHHLCGPQFDDYLPAGATLSRFYYVVMWAYSLVLSLAALRPFLRGDER